MRITWTYVAVTKDEGQRSNRFFKMPSNLPAKEEAAIARALKVFEGEWDKPLRDAGLLTRDSRMKERKKYGLHGARRGTQFSKR